MRIRITVDDQLMQDALRATGIENEEEAIEAGLRLLLCASQQDKIRSLRGKLHWEDDLSTARSAQ